MDEGSLQLVPYNRMAAVHYARKWAYGRNPAFYDYERIGGDCTNFASQCVYAGSGVMNYTKDLGWYYIDANNKAPAWTGVEYFYNFMTRQEQTPGPVAQEASISQMEPGDVIQLSFDGESWNHSPVVVQLLHRPALQPADVLIAAHSYDADNRPLSTYDYKAIRFLHFIGVRKPVR
ncbi:MAG: amidase domain-containing protein [Oscillospiraceae bacterium]|nr:amidase domain-containing protein [Oscillospiraceae bacterium]